MAKCKDCHHVGRGGWDGNQLGRYACGNGNQLGLNACMLAPTPSWVIMRDAKNFGDCLNPLPLIHTSVLLSTKPRNLGILQN